MSIFGKVAVVRLKSEKENVIKYHSFIKLESMLRRYWTVRIVKRYNLKGNASSSRGINMPKYQIREAFKMKKTTVRM